MKKKTSNNWKYFPYFLYINQIFFRGKTLYKFTGCKCSIYIKIGFNFQSTNDKVNYFFTYQPIFFRGQTFNKFTSTFV